MNLYSLQSVMGHQADANTKDCSECVERREIPKINKLKIVILLSPMDT